MTHPITLAQVLSLCGVHPNETIRIYKDTANDMPESITANDAKSKYQASHMFVISIQPYFICGEYEGWAFTVDTKSTKNWPAPSGPNCEQAACDANDQINSLTGQFLDKTTDEFEKTLRIASQKMARARRKLHNLGSDAAFYLGAQFGCQQTLLKLLRNKNALDYISETVNRASESTVRILDYLSQPGMTRSHPEIAANLNMDYDELTKHIAPLIICQAVQASRTGKNTRYTLTRHGKRFYRQHQTKR